ncbi:TatD family hydrolase [Nitratireductor sp. L1-7-SE]|uniref:TatD family hydrolase n=1 Tax=Nitratireductor rhodophyticola TaxID=2854036 RepID=A0ABS7REG7_9HYPH|nr:Qat anti-phage system TatD family nuclease QatD [Nitratireductor rhodophyticola]MBY8919044.1 TatD family hydrolase [Nitratireductor rhodophyticola]MBY8920198.1 TatD family hydrolase [Nitratireductor rhodophyticola]
MRSTLVDFHCHLDLYPDHAAAVERCERDGVFTLTVTTTPKAWPRNYELASATRHVRVALGLHPQLVTDRAHEIGLWEELLPRTRYVGEVGLDASPRFYKSLGAQKEVFARVLSLCSAAGNKIVSTHSVRATKAVLDMIEQLMPPSRGRVVLHWFTGTAAEARRAVDLGCYFSVNAEMLINEKRAAITKTLPLHRVLTETDGPFTQASGHPATPSDVGIAVEGLARLHGTSFSDMSATILSNLKGLLAERS